MYKFLDPKFTTFSRLFPKQPFIFPDSRSPNNYVIKRDLENAVTRFFSRMRCKLRVTTIMKLIHSVIVLATGKIERDLNTEKIHFLSNCCNVEKENKKIPDFLPFFKTLSLFSEFFHIWKIALQILRHFQEFKTLYKSCIYPLVISCRLYKIMIKSQQKMKITCFSKYCIYNTLNKYQ